MTQIIDLGADDNIEMRIPFQQALPWLVINNSFSTTNISYNNSAAPTFNVNNLNDNGCFTIRVMNVLSAPVASAPVTILISVRGADNLEFANPISPGTTVQPFVVQSHEMPIDVTTHMGTARDSEEKHKMLVNFGEVIKSLRPLMRRSNYLQSLTWLYSGTGNIVDYYYQFHKVPPYPGYDPNGESLAKGIITPASTFNYNYVYWHPFQWISLAFVSYRGAVMWHFNTNNDSRGDTNNDLRVTRVPNAPFKNNRGTNPYPLSLTSESSNVRAMIGITRNTAAGVAVTNQTTQSGLSVSTPNYTNYLMQSTDPRSATRPSTTAQQNDGSTLDTFVYSNIIVGAQNNTTTSFIPKTDIYCGVGTDFNLYFFLNCPVLYKTSNPLPVAS